MNGALFTSSDMLTHIPFRMVSQFRSTSYVLYYRHGELLLLLLLFLQSHICTYYLYIYTPSIYTYTHTIDVEEDI